MPAAPLEFRSDDAERRYAELVRLAPGVVVGLDMDGTLAPIVDDPAVAHIHPDAAQVLVELAPRIAAIAVITGRPARQALALGGLDDVGEQIAAAGKELFVFGQYGNETWTSAHRSIRSPRPPAGLASFERELPSLLRRLDLADAYVEEKGLAVGVHTRRMAEPDAALERLRAPLGELAARHGLAVEPGRQVIEVRGAGMTKGDAVHRLAERLEATGFIFGGDDLGDLAAFDAVRELDESGVTGLTVCSLSRESSELAEQSDLVVSGPTGVLSFLREFTADAAAAAG